jgi:K+-sensing histidine kinase KdpD
VFETVKNAGKTVLVMGLAAGLSLLIASVGVGNESIIMLFLLSVLFTAVLTSSRSFALQSARRSFAPCFSICYLQSPGIPSLSTAQMT